MPSHQKMPYGRIGLQHTSRDPPVGRDSVNVFIREHRGPIRELRMLVQIIRHGMNAFVISVKETGLTQLRSASRAIGLRGKPKSSDMLGQCPWSEPRGVRTEDSGGAQGGKDRKMLP